MLSLNSVRAPSLSGVWADYFALTKPRLLFMVLLSVLVGFCMGTAEGFHFYGLILALIGTALAAGGAMALNEFIERAEDAQMTRTKDRPLPAGRLEPKEALVFGILLSVFGFFLLALQVNWMSALLALATSVIYLLAYTPLKKKSSLATLVGAVPGAIPPLIGWAAASGSVAFPAFILFLIVFFWQLPHFLAIAWMYRSDYERAGFPMLSVVEGGAALVARQMILYLSALLPVSLLPAVFGCSGVSYFFGAFALGMSFAGVVIVSASRLDTRARYVLRASVVYLAAVLVLMVSDKI